VAFAASFGGPRLHRDKRRPPLRPPAGQFSFGPRGLWSAGACSRFGFRGLCPQPTTHGKLPRPERCARLCAIPRGAERRAEKAAPEPCAVWHRAETAALQRAQRLAPLRYLHGHVRSFSGKSRRVWVARVLPSATPAEASTPRGSFMSRRCAQSVTYSVCCQWFDNTKEDTKSVLILINSPVEKNPRHESRSVAIRWFPHSNSTGPRQCAPLSPRR